MSNLKLLIKEKCPFGVKKSLLRDVATIKRGERITKKNLMAIGQYIVFSGGVLPMGRFNKINRKANTITISSYGAAGFVNFVTEDFWANDVCLTVFPKPMVNNKYLYYALKNQQEYIYKNTTKAIPDHIPTEFLENLEIPVPPLEVQCEIVRILDNFTEFTSELTSELIARKKQYEYYRDSVILNSNYKRTKLSEICTDSFRGAGIKREHVTDIGIPCVRYGEIYTSYGVYFDSCISRVDPADVPNKKKLKYGDLLFAITGESVEDIAKTTTYIGQEEGLVGGDIVVVRHQQNPKYLSYALSTSDAVTQKGKGKVKSKVVHSSLPAILNLEVPLPTLEEQNRVVKLLDNFNNLSNDISEGLPAEIESRKKQYEYYRKEIFSLLN